MTVKRSMSNGNADSTKEWCSPFCFYSIQTLGKDPVSLVISLAPQLLLNVLCPVFLSKSPEVLSSKNMSKAILPTGPASAGERSCWGTGALLNVSSMTVLWSAEPEMRTLSMAQSFWSRPSCRGCHQRKRVAISLASGGRRIFTNLTENGESGGKYLLNISYEDKIWNSTKQQYIPRWESFAKSWKMELAHHSDVSDPVCLCNSLAQIQIRFWQSYCIWHKNK